MRTDTEKKGGGTRVSEHDLDLETLQEVVDLGPYQLRRCTVCRGVNIDAKQVRCCWCGATLSACRRTASTHPRPERQGPRGPNGGTRRPNDRRARA